MKDPGSRDASVPPTRRKFFYGWIIVALCCLILATQWGVQYSFSVFFKPLIADFGWSRAATSGVYSVLMISAAVSAMPSGWLADKFGPAKLTAICGFLIGLGLVLAGQVSSLWQLYLTFGFMVGIGSGGTFAITTGMTARWFVKKRGLALGIVSSGIGLGTLVMSPIAERMIDSLGWPQTYFIVGIATWVIVIGSALFLRRDPEAIGCRPYGAEELDAESGRAVSAPPRRDVTGAGVPFSSAVWMRPLWIIMFSFFVFNVCVQLVMVHLVNYATDIGIDSFAAATIVSVVGFGSLAGRLVMGGVSDRIGAANTMIICCLGLTGSLIWLIFCRELWMFYVFAIFFSFPYGGEVPQTPLLVGQFFGLRSVIALVGMVSAGTRLGGALGSWIGGQIFDMTQSYTVALAIAALAAFCALMTAVMLKRTRPVVVAGAPANLG